MKKSMGNVEKNKAKKRETRLTICALILAFIVLVIGFLAYSNTITVERELKEHGNLYNIGFSKYKDKLVGGYVDPFIMKFDMSTATPQASSAYLFGNVVTNIWAEFYAPGQYVTYKFHIYNASKDDMYLKDILFKDVLYTNKSKICTPLDPTISSEVLNDVCEHITLGVIDSSYSLDAKYNSVTNIKGVKIKSKESSDITVILGYETGAPLAPTPFNIKFGDIEFRYSLFK